MLVTGASGFLGRHLVRGPVGAEWEVIAPTSSAMDITSRSLADALRRGEIDDLLRALGMHHDGHAAGIGEPLPRLRDGWDLNPLFPYYRPAVIGTLPAMYQLLPPDRLARFRAVLRSNDVNAPIHGLFRRAALDRTDQRANRVARLARRSPAPDRAGSG